MSTFLRDLAVALAAAAGAGVLCKKLRQPPVLGYLLAGMIVGPNVPYFFTIERASILGLADLGVVVILFCIGLELSLKRLLNLGATVLIAGVLQMATMIWLGYSVGLLLGWSGTASLFLGAMLSISSTVIIVHAFKEQGRADRAARVTLGILVLEDLAAIFLLAILSTLAERGDGADASLLAPAMRLCAYLVVTLVAGMFIVPRALRSVERLKSDETLLLSSVGLCFAAALSAGALGYSPALGAFLAGVLAAESGLGERIEHLLAPLRDVLSAVFFVSIGMLLAPADLWANALAVVGLSVLLILGKFFSATLGAFLAGESLRTSVCVGAGLGQIGEFSFLIAELGVRGRVVPEHLYAVSVGVCALTSLSTPYALGSSDAIASWIDRRMPRSMQAFTTLYGSWIERLRSSKAKAGDAARFRRLFAFLALDTLIVVAIVVAFAMLAPDAEEPLSRATGLQRNWIAAAMHAVELAALTPFLFGVFRIARAVAQHLADRVFPANVGRSPRGAFVAGMQLLIVGITAVVILAVTQPFVPPFRGGILLIVLIGILAIAFRRSIVGMTDHVQAGAEVILAAIAENAGAAATEKALDDLEAANPSVGNLESVAVDPAHFAAGKSLGELNLRGVSGASVIAVLRAGGDVASPGAPEVIRGGDTLILCGSKTAVGVAKRALALGPHALTSPHS